MATIAPTPAATTDLAGYCRDVAQRAKAASMQMAVLGSGVKIEWLRRSAELLRKSVPAIEQANAKDLAAAPDYGLTPAEIDRLRLNAKGVESIAAALEEVAQIRRVILLLACRQSFNTHAPRLPLEEAHLFRVRAQVDEPAGPGATVQEVPFPDRDVPVADIDETCVEFDETVPGTEIPAPQQAARQAVFARASAVAGGIGSGRRRNIIEPHAVTVDDHRSRKAATSERPSSRGVPDDPAVLDGCRKPFRIGTLIVNARLNSHRNPFAAASLRRQGPLGNRLKAWRLSVR